MKQAVVGCTCVYILPLRQVCVIGCPYFAYSHKHTVSVEGWCGTVKQDASASCSPDSGSVAFLLTPCPKYLNLPHLFFPTVFEIDVIWAS